MWNSTDGMYSNVFYGANFVDYVGAVENKMTIVRPVNGTRYDTFVLRQYFDIDLAIDGAQAPDKITLAAMKAINEIPENLTYEDRHIVENARALYNKIVSDEQRVLVTNYDKLLKAERTIAALAPEEEVEEVKTISGWLIAGIAVAAAVLSMLAVAFIGAMKETRGEKREAKALLLLTWSRLKKIFGFVIMLPVKIYVLLMALIAAIFKGIYRLIKWPFTHKIRFAKKSKAKEETEETEPKKKRFQLNIDPKYLRYAKIGLYAVAVLLVAGLIVWMFIGGGEGSAKEENPYMINDAENYNISIRYDANGGSFTTNTTVIVDSYNISDLPQEGNLAKLALLAPNNEARAQNAFNVNNGGYFLAGWYQNRMETGTDAEGNPIYTYSGKWNFETDVLELDTAGEYSASEPVLTLYAAWVPLFQVELYDRTSGELVQTMTYDPTSGQELLLPAWNEETGAMKMNAFPKRAGYTFVSAYYDSEGKNAADTQVVHPGTVDESNATAQNATLKLYVDWKEGEWYRITTAKQFADNANIKGCYEILADLDFSNVNWPTGLAYGKFAGTIQGNGHTIRNVNLIQKDNSKNNAGLFGMLTENAVLKDVTFENVTFTIQAGAKTRDTSFGLLAGTVAEGVTFENVKILSGKLVIDCDYFLNEEYTIGLLCGSGTVDLDISGITCELSEKAAKAFTLTQNGNEIKLTATEGSATEPSVEGTEPTTEPTTEETTEPTTATTEPTV